MMALKNTPAANQWRLDHFQMVNWGGFEGGPHRIDLSADSTLISGATGTGKSTFLDAYLALLMPSRIPFNGASNSNTTGRARGENNRNVLSYMRGKLDDERDPVSGKLIHKVLRGDHRPTWSAIAATWHSTDGRWFTAARLYYAPPSAERFDDIVKRMITIESQLSLDGFEQFAPGGFDPVKLRSHFPALEVPSTYYKFCNSVCDHLGIGATGEGERALGLLARIQAGREVTTIDDLFKTMVLEAPVTFQLADDALRHFDDIQISYEAMKTAEAQVKTLNGIIEWHQRLTDARAEMAAIDQFGLFQSGITPLTLWQHSTEARMLESEIAAVIEAKKREQHSAAKAKTLEAELGTQVHEITDSIREAGGGELERLERETERLNIRRTAVHDALELFTERTQLLGAPPRSAQAFAELKTASTTFLTMEYPASYSQLDHERDQDGIERHETEKHLAELKAELASLQTRPGLMPRNMHAARELIADSLGWSVHDLPFVGELIDMAPGFEEWRLAADRAIRSFATVMLVDRDKLKQFRIQINELHLNSRIRFRGAPLNHPTPSAPKDSRLLPARLVVDPDSAFAGWVADQIARRYGYTCVENAAGLDAVDRGITITGQTKDGDQGAHGGQDRPVIGFSNQTRQSELTDEINQGLDDLNALIDRHHQLKEQLEQLANRRDAHRHVADCTWEQIDIMSATDALAQLQQRHQQLLFDNDPLAQLKAEREDLRSQLEHASKSRHLAEDQEHKLSEKHAVLAERQDEVATALAEAEETGQILDLAIAERLDAEFAKLAIDNPTAASLDSARAKIIDALKASTRSAERIVNDAERELTGRFEAFQTNWARPDLSTSLNDYPAYHDILVELNSEGLHQRRIKFTHEVVEWNGIDLLRLHGAITESIDEIKDRLDPINRILANLEFGANRDRLHMTMRHKEFPDVARFRQELAALCSNVTEMVADEEIDSRYNDLKTFMNQLRGEGRDHLIDVRRHIQIEAERRDANDYDKILNVYVSVAGKSGGESQELIAFIVGAALRYQLGSADWPRYAPVILDEGFIKSDESFTGRALEAWKGLGFQLIVGAPDDKVNSIERHVDRVLCVTKNPRGYSHITTLRDHETT
ncbi:cytosolic protein [Mycobacteroides abscessus subsp. abscessus]|uniref:ATP-binding protein n=2 Tax=Mycobacteroides abscessus TaxID=36809 RepID=UPI0009272746|nr:ATP-binding protein [Mycobacteroides abscessus]SHY07447.1 cytosolic protein [Mycobacteroides abscessus subsp. abscessus]SIC74901.1 cytosolic protein [Mycobacteroides abscessus subsp. abscessus]SKP28750.1 cytosolic protein [Mycobacteroides abscessus subsp. abscessus]